MTSFFKIAAYNTQALYFWGTEENAERYVDCEINTYSAQAIPEAEWSDYEDRDDVLNGTEAYWDDFMEGDE